MEAMKQIQSKLNIDDADDPDQQDSKEQETTPNLFEAYLDRPSIFAQKTVLQTKYLPENIPHRKAQINQLSMILAPALRLEKPSNLFLYGKTGTGKTLCITHTLNNLKETAKSRNAPIIIMYLNCKLKKIADTEYRVIAHLARALGEEVPITGLPTDEVYNIFQRKLDKEERIAIVILDEIDQLVKKIGDGMLYTLTRLNAELKNTEVCIIGISNDVRFMDNIDPRVKSSLGEEEIIFPPYNAIEIKDILEKRSQKAFNKNAVHEGVLAKCAAYAAREHGDARRALDLLRVAGEMAEREGSLELKPNHIDLAEEKIEKSRVLEITQTQPKQSQIVLQSILLVADENKGAIMETGEIFERYKAICKETGNNILTQRRISDLISELDMLGIINAKLISKGRYGRTREIYLTIPNELVDKIKDVLKSELY